MRTHRILAVILISFFITAIGNRVTAGVYQSGEELKYRVSYLGITLGYITVITEDKEQLDGRSVYKVKSIMESAKGIPFVDLKTIYESWMDESLTYSYKFEGKTTQSGEYSYQKIVFDYTKGFVLNQKWIANKPTLNISIGISKKYNDGLSLFFLARENLKSNRKMIVPTIMENDTVRTIINFKNQLENIENKNINYKVRTLYFNGKAEWTGIYGMSGNFEGWFSDDDARIPIKAKIKVYIGSVDVILIKWKRSNWAPPNAG